MIFRRLPVPVSFRLYSTTKSYNFIKTRTECNEKVGVIQLHRPEALNALSDDIFTELNDALHHFDKSDSIGAIVLTGSEKAFAAGADIKQMSNRGFVENYQSDFLGSWNFVSSIRKPIIAAVNGFALGGGCELAMMCDVILAGNRAKFGQPEIKLGTIPGGGGTQRLIRAIGKSRSMEMILTGKMISADEAERFGAMKIYRGIEVSPTSLTIGLVSKVYPADVLMIEALKMAETIANYSQPIVKMAKEAVNAAYEMGQQQGLQLERRLFQSSFATKDQKEGMSAFLAKRDPKFENK